MQTGMKLIAQTPWFNTNSVNVYSHIKVPACSQGQVMHNKICILHISCVNSATNLFKFQYVRYEWSQDFVHPILFHHTSLYSTHQLNSVQSSTQSWLNITQKVVKQSWWATQSCLIFKNFKSSKVIYLVCVSWYRTLEGCRVQHHHNRG